MSPDGLSPLFQNIIIDIAAGLIASVIIGTLAWLRKQYTLLLGRLDPRLPAILFVMLCVIWATLNLLAVYFAYQYFLPYHLSAIVFIATSAPLAFFVWKELDQYWRIGLRGADQQVRNGINYRRALELCRNELTFLGTGAAKLTREEEFEKALLRCRHDRPIRFLLSSPSDDNLTLAAQRAGRAKDEYKHIVLTSLKRLVDIRERRGIKNIEVRFYPSSPEFVPIFRLMFIDDSLCLTSPVVFGEGDGSQLPQIHIVKPPGYERVMNSLYYSLQLYFEWLWNSSSAWDFKTYL